MFLLPSRGRPNLLQRFFDKGRPSLPGVVILDEDDASQYTDVEYPENWASIVYPRMYLSHKLNAAFKSFANSPWFGILNDDHVPLTEDWDRKLINKLPHGSMVWPSDNLYGRISTPVFCGDLVRKIGWITCPSLNHFYLDDVHELMAEELKAKCESDIVVSHEHFTAGRGEFDKTYQERPSSEADKKSFESWKSNDWPTLKQLLCVQ